MPAISLVVCAYRESKLLQRLLREAEGCFDELVVAHDGPDLDNVRGVVEGCGGRFFERARAFQQESHWPFVWGQAKHDWILRLDADEFPSVEMKAWLKAFRQAEEPGRETSGFTCIWPLWDGRREITRKLYPGRIFLFHRQRVSFFGMNEQVPIADTGYTALDFVLHHQPTRKSFGLKNILWRKQAYIWRERLARSLLGKPTDLNCWRFTSESWPASWEQMRQKPLRTALQRVTVELFRTLRNQRRIEGKVFLGSALNGSIHHALICLKYWQLRLKGKSVDE